MKKPVWEKARPKGIGKPKALTPAQKASAKASAKKAGRPYPNLVDNMRAAKVRKFADGGIVNVAAPPVGMTDLSGAPQQVAQPVQQGPYSGPADYGMSSGNTGTMSYQPSGYNVTARNRMTGAIGTLGNQNPQGFAKGGLVTARGMGKVIKAKPCKIC